VLKFANGYVDYFYPLYMAYMLGIANLLNAISFVPLMLVFKAFGGGTLVYEAGKELNKSAKGSTSEPIKRKPKAD